jgi:hypothetical protein
MSKVQRQSISRAQRVVHHSRQDPSEVKITVAKKK